MEDDETSKRRAFIEDGLQRIGPRLPSAVRYRLENSLDHFSKAFKILDIDRAMASFRAITGEEEATTALMRAIQLRQYPGAKSFNARNHIHKAAVGACIAAIGLDMRQTLQRFQLTFKYDVPRIDISVPLSTLGVVTPEGEDYFLQPVEPLSIVHAKPGKERSNLFEDNLVNIAEETNFESIRKLVASQANARNTLLYAGDSSLPVSRASVNDLWVRKDRAMLALILATMVLQSKDHQPLVCDAIDAFLSVVSRLDTQTAKDDMFSTR